MSIWVHFKAAVCVVTVALAIFPSSANAWGGEGHRLVAMVADRHLSPAARAGVRRDLSGSMTLVDASTWMDDIRGEREGRSMSNWHFMNVNVCAKAPQMTCHGQACVVGQLQKAVDALRSANQPDRTLALKVLVHLIGDIHQPLHVGEQEDRGGNETRIANRSCSTSQRHAAGEGCSLHKYWDSTLVKRLTRGNSERDVADYLEQKFAAIQPGAVDPRAWASQSWSLAKDVAYAGQCIAGGRLVVGENYDQASEEVVARQIYLAGLRLAQVLNQAYK